jgi:hypothetical protein
VDDIFLCKTSETNEKELQTKVKSMIEMLKNKIKYAFMLPKNDLQNELIFIFLGQAKIDSIMFMTAKKVIIGL